MGLPDKNPISEIERSNKYPHTVTGYQYSIYVIYKSYQETSACGQYVVVDCNVIHI